MCQWTDYIYFWYCFIHVIVSKDELEIYKHTLNGQNVAGLGFIGDRTAEQTLYCSVPEHL